MGLYVIDGDEAFYFLHKDGKLQGAVLMHVDDFSLAGTNKFIEEIITGVKETLNVSKVERDRVRFTGLDICSVANKIKISMMDYVQSLEDVSTIRKANCDEELTRLELKEYRKMTGKLSWLANSTRPDLSYTALQMSKKNNSATISDLRNINKVLMKVRERESKVQFGRIGKKEDLMIVGIGDALYKSDDKAVGGVLLFLTDARMTRASPMYWKAKQIEYVCHSSKDADTQSV